MKTVRFLFSDAMARAIVEGRKTATRRPVAGVDGYGVAPCHFSSTGFASVERVDGQPAGRCICSREVKPPCAPGDMLIGRECFQAWTGGEMSGYEEAEGVLDFDYAAYSFTYRADGDCTPKRWRPSIHMPDWAARIRRRVFSVAVERLQDISAEDAAREGFATRHDFLCAWDDIYMNRNACAALNPWVWRIEFSRENVVQDGTP